MKTKYFHLSIIFFLLFTNLLTAQDKDSTKIIIKEVIIKKDSVTNSLQKKKWALIFEVGSNFTLKSFEGLVFALKYHLTDKSSIRFGIGDEKFEDNTLESIKPKNVFVVDSSDWGNMFLLTYLLYPKPKSDVNLILGIGLKFAYDIYKTKYYYINIPEAYYFKYQQVYLGLTFHLGVEYFITKGISIFGEYSGEVLYFNKKRSINSVYGQSAPSIYYGLKFKYAIVRTGISAYFDFPF
jgi:hypothetical protein